MISEEPVQSRSLADFWKSLKIWKAEEALDEYGITLLDSPVKGSYHAVIVAVNHDEYKNLEESDFSEMLKNEEGVFVDVKGIYRDRISKLDYWSL